MNTILSDYLTRYRELISKELIYFLTERKQQLGKINFWGNDVLERLVTFVPQGKLIRGSLVLLTQEMFGEKITPESIQAAAALELSQSAILIHDDIIDADEVRRGKPSLFKQYEELGKRKKIASAVHFGPAMAICVGDIGFFLSFELLNNLKVESSVRKKIVDLYTQEMQIVGLAEMQDVYIGMSSEISSEAEILNLYTQKTGRYSFVLPMNLGALLINLPETEIKVLHEFGQNLGLLFQIKDDELSLFGTQAQTGKPIGTDVMRNNKTLYHFYLFTTATTDEKNRLQKIFGNSHATAEDIDYIKKLVVQYNIPEKITEKMNMLETTCKTHITQLQISEVYKNILTELILFSRNRTV